MENIFMHFYQKELDEKKSEPCIAWGWDVRFLDVDCGGEEVKKSDDTFELALWLSLKWRYRYFLNK